MGAPTVINNVETLANVPRILTRCRLVSVHWPGQSPGTKTFALTGEVENTGLIEVPMGLALEDIVFQIGGGIRGGGKLSGANRRSLRWVLNEGADGHFLDFDSLQEVGAMIGSVDLWLWTKTPVWWKWHASL